MSSADMDSENNAGATERVDDPNQCPICLNEEGAEGNNVVFPVRRGSSCKHKVHKECFAALLTNSLSWERVQCPLCRTVADVDLLNAVAVSLRESGHLGSPKITTIKPGHAHLPNSKGNLVCEASVRLRHMIGMQACAEEPIYPCVKRGVMERAQQMVDALNASPEVKKLIGSLSFQQVRSVVAKDIAYFKTTRPYDRWQYTDQSTEAAEQLRFDQLQSSMDLRQECQRLGDLYDGIIEKVASSQAAAEVARAVTVEEQQLVADHVAQSHRGQRRPREDGGGGSAGRQRTNTSPGSDADDPTAVEEARLPAPAAAARGIVGQVGAFLDDMREIMREQAAAEQMNATAAREQAAALTLIVGMLVAERTASRED